MTNLSDLFPAGAGKQVAFTASGTLSSGQTVFLKADGTVEGVQDSAGTVTNHGMNNGFALSATSKMPTAWDSTNNVLVVFSQNSSSYPTITAGTVSGTTITFGTSVVVYSAVVAAPAQSMGLAHGNGAYGLAVFSYSNACHISGYSISGTTVTSEGLGYGSTAVSPVECMSIGYQENDNAFIVQSYAQFNSSIEVHGGTYSGGSPSLSNLLSTGYGFGLSGGGNSNADFAYDSTQQKMIWIVRSDSSPYVRYGIMDYGGGSFSIYDGTVATGHAYMTQAKVAYDVAADRGIIAFNYDSTNNLQVVTIDVGASSATVGTPTTVISGTSYGSTQYDVTYDPVNERTVLAYQKNDVTDQNALVVQVDSGGSTITLGANTVLHALGGWQVTSSVFDAQNNRVLVTFYGSGGDCDTDFLSVGDTNNLGSFIGITDEAISSAASGNVTIKGGISTNVSSLTPGSDYYVQGDGSISTTSTAPAVKIGKALSATAINLEYQS